jgi:YesN/AraC family two-component response regulator
MVSRHNIPPSHIYTPFPLSCQDIRQALTLISVCKHFGISQPYISRLFRKYTGQSFINYLTLVRIEKAKQYLTNKNTLVKDAAAMVGFNDQFYFSRVFHSITGQSPSAYIQINSAQGRG